MRQSDANRRKKLTNLAISDENKEDAQHVAASALAAYQQAVADLSTPSLISSEPSSGRPSMDSSRTSAWSSGNTPPSGPSCWRLIDSDSYRVEGYFRRDQDAQPQAGRSRSRSIS